MKLLKIMSNVKSACRLSDASHGLWHGLLLASILIIAIPSVHGSRTMDLDSGGNRICKKLNIPTTEDIEDLEIGVAVNVVLEANQQKRFLLNLNSSSPLNFSFTFSGYSKNVVRNLYFNQKINMSKYLRKPRQKELFLHCALNGQYDLIVKSKKRGSIKIEVNDQHPISNWTLLPISIPNQIRTMNRLQKKRMIIKWSKTKVDIHAIQYCLVISPLKRNTDFCRAVSEFMESEISNGNCYPGTPMDFIWHTPPSKVKKIDPNITTVICSGTRTQQVVEGLVANRKYFIDIFGVHIYKHNLTFHMKSSTVWFNQTHPKPLRASTLGVKRISGMSRVSVFSYKIPYHYPEPTQLRYLILPCGGSQIDAKILKQRQKVLLEKAIYRPTYITVPNVKPGERYIMRISPSNEDEYLRAKRVAIAISTNKTFSIFPELPENSTVFEIRSTWNCRSTTISWYSSPDTRDVKYCVYIFEMQNRNRSSIENTDYCMDFKNVEPHTPLLYAVNFVDPIKIKHRKIEYSLLNLNPGEMYIVYVTIRLNGSDVRELPYQTLRIKMKKHCHTVDIEKSSEDFNVLRLSYR